MAIDVCKDELLTLAQVAEFFPRDRTGKKVHPSAVWRWCQPGQSPRLEAVRVRRSWYTTRAAVRAFVDAHRRDEPEPAPRSRTERERAVAAAERRLDQMGVK